MVPHTLPSRQPCTVALSVLLLPWSDAAPPSHPPGRLLQGTADEPGIIPLAVQEVFQLIGACQDREFLLRVSYMEVCSVVDGSLMRG